MSVSVELPADLKACPTCGNDPEQAKRLHWLAACPDDHVVHVWFDINWLAEKIVHQVSTDAGTRRYAAGRLEYRRTGSSDQALLDWLDKVHSGEVPIREREWDDEIEYDVIEAPAHVS